MTAFREIAIAALLASLALAATPAQACDSNYPWLCKPAPSIDPPEASGGSDQADAKPTKMISRRATAAARAKRAQRGKVKAGTTQQATRATDSGRKRSARKAAARQLVLRARKAAPAAADDDEADTRPAADAAAEPRQVAPKRAGALAQAAADNTREPTTGFAALWAERGAGQPVPSDARVPGTAVSQASSAQAPSSPVPATQAVETSPQPASPPVQVVPQDEINALDLAADDPPPSRSETGWLRALFLAFGGILALGSAVRLFL